MAAAAPAPSGKSNPLPLLLAVGAIAVLLVVVLIEAVVILLPSGAVSEAGEATLSALHGQVLVQKGGQGEWIEVVQDIAVEAGDRIRTADASYAALTFLEGTTSQLSELTELTIDELQLTGGRRVVIKLDLDVGQIWNRIAALPEDSLHEVSTLAATVTCHGSEYGVVVNEMGTTWIRGQQGRVEVTAGGSTVPVAPGDTLMVELGSSPVSYASVAMVPTAPAEQSSGEATTSVQAADMPTFLNQPLPTGIPTVMPSPSATSRPAPPAPSPPATSPPQPTATKKTVECPTITIREPSRAPARGPFGIEFDRQPGLPGGYIWVVEFRQPPGGWSRAEPVPANVTKRGQFWMAELRAPGAEGTWHWRICIAPADHPYAPGECCSTRQVIDHATDDGSDDGC
jgi:hypothetical protein